MLWERWLAVCRYSTLDARKRILLVLLLIVAAAGVVVLYRHYDPTHSHLAPKCVIKSLTGFSCPGCGFQRQLYNLANLRFVDALKCNYFLPLGFLYLAALLVSSQGSRLRRALASKRAIAAFIVLYVSWGVVRNVLGV